MRHIALSEPGGPEVLIPSTRERPEAGPGEVLIKVSAAGVNGPDIAQRKGNYPAPAGASDILGLEVAGTVIARGAQAERWQMGDQICALTNGGGYAEFVTVPQDQCLPIPRGLSMVEAASLPETAFTVWSNLYATGGLRPQESVLVHGGTSGIGVMAIQMANALGSTVYATAGSPKKCAFAEKLGATLTVNYRTQDFVEVLNDATGGQGVDLILDMVGGDYVGKNLKLAALDGRILNIAFQQGFKAEVNFVPLLMKRLTLTASTLRSRSGEAKAEIATALQQHIWPLIEQGKIRPVIDRSFRLEEAAEAHRLVESSQHIGKVVLLLEET